MFILIMVLATRVRLAYQPTCALSVLVRTSALVRHLARLELKVIFEELIPRLRNPHFKGEPKFVRSYFVNSIKEMNITFDPER